MEFPATLEHLPLVMDYLRSHIKQFGVEDKLIRKIELACEEAIVNIIHYAYPEKKGKISIFCENKGRKFEIILVDHGVPFNPIDADVNLQTNVPVEEREMGGLGIFLLRRSIDEASYQRIGDSNVLRLAFNM